MDAFNQGLIVSVFGVGITFLVLAAVILLIKLVLALFPAKSVPLKSTKFKNQAKDLSEIAVIAAAWWLGQKDVNPSLGKRLEESPGRWWHRADR